MKKDKDWLKEEVEEKMEDTFFGPYILIEHLAEIIDQLEETEKVAIPQFVADFLKGKQDWAAFEIFYDIDGANTQNKEIYNWLYETETGFARESVLLNALRYGYTIETKPYWVVKFESVTFCPFVDDIGYFKEIYKFTEKEKAEAVALLINGTVERIEVKK